MNTSPRRDVEVKRTVIVCMNMQAVENKLERGQRDGDATKVITSGEIESLNESIPRMESSSVGSYKVNSKNNTRTFANGQVVKANINKVQKEMYEARIKEQEEIELDDNEK